MPQERPNHYGHLLDRKLSPKFPTIAEARQRRQRAEDRLMLVGLWTGVAAAVAGLVLFVLL